MNLKVKRGFKKWLKDKSLNYIIYRRLKILDIIMNHDRKFIVFCKVIKKSVMCNFVRNLPDWNYKIEIQPEEQS